MDKKLIAYYRVSTADQSIEGRLHDTMMALLYAIRRVKAAKSDQQDVSATVLYVDGAKRETVTVICHVGPGDKGEPVFTIGLREDF